MKMYVWLRPSRIQYGSDFIAVVAESLEEAKKIALHDHEYGMDFGKMIEQTDRWPGEPTKVYDLPCGVYFMQSE